MRVIARKFKLHKAGNRPEEYEDAMHAAKADRDGVTIYRFAVADGATESPFSGLWAKLLVHAFTDGSFDCGISESCFDQLRRKWEEQIPSGNIPWYLEEKLREGSYAALAGLLIVPEGKHADGGIAHLRAVGDCCVFQIRRNGMRSFPIVNSVAFNSRPHLLGTANRPLPPGAYSEVTWKWKVGDAFLLMSDALAAWYIEQREPESDRRKAVFAEGQTEREWRKWFENLVASERVNGALKNDDISLWTININK